MPQPIPVVVIGGFLGAGKTTLLNHVLNGSLGIRAGIVVNDFGAINIDAQMIVGVDENDTVALANGCVCCSIRDDLIDGCLRLLDRPVPPELLLIETSGVSEPIEVFRSLDEPLLNRRLRVEGLLTVVDADTLPALLKSDTAALARAQIAGADLIVLNKCDLVDEAQRKRVRAEIHSIQSSARIFETNHAQLPLDVLLAPDTAHRQSLHKREETKATAPHGFEAVSWTSTNKLSLPLFKAFLESLPDTLFRAKGFLLLEELPPYRISFQMAGRRYNLHDGEAWGAEPPCSEIVFIGCDGTFDDLNIADRLDACAGTGDEARSPVLRLSRRLLVST